MPYKDRAKQRAAQHRSYIRNRARVIESSTYNRKERRLQLHKMLREAKDVPCTDCGIQYPYYVMEFDHVRGEKVGHVSAMVHETVPVQMLLDEMAKCEVVCANCHRVRTFEGKTTRKLATGHPC